MIARSLGLTVLFAGMQRIIYTSRPGFVGRDAFVFARRGLTKIGAQPSGLLKSQ